MSIHEIVLPETKPETEWILGRAVQKMSPKRKHGSVQLAFGSALRDWARGRGTVATEWRFRIAPPGEIRRPLVPDVSYVSFERLRGLEDEDLDVPPFAPDVAVEVLSPGEPPRRIAHKIAVYLAGGCELVIVVDPATRTARLHDAHGETALGGDDLVRHAALPGFAVPLASLFADLDDRG